MIKIFLLLLLQAFFFFSFGSLICHLINKKAESFSLSMILGFLSFFSLFELTALPLTLLKQPLSRLSLVWMLFTGCVLAVSVILCHRDWLRMLLGLKDKLRAHSWLLLLLAGCFLLQMVMVYTHGYQGADSSYYVGKVSTDVYTNSLGIFDPYTGNPLSRFNIRYLFSCFPDYNAVICQVFRMPALFQARTIIPLLVVVIANLVYYRIGLLLFKEDRKKSSLLVFFVFLINEYSQTIYTPATFLFTRSYEGKSILANVILPVILYGLLSLWKEEQLLTRLLLLAASVSSVAFSTSSMLIVPIAFIAGYAIRLVIKKDLHCLGWYLLYILPNLCTALFYILDKLKLITIPI